MKEKWKDWFTDECDICKSDLTKEGMVYVIRNKQGICIECYETIVIYLIDVNDTCPACSKWLVEGSCMECGENYE